MIRREESFAWLLTARTVDRGSRGRKVIVIRLRNRNRETGPENEQGVTESVKKKRGIFLTDACMQSHEGLCRCPVRGNNATCCSVILSINREIAEKQDEDQTGIGEGL